MVKIYFDFLIMHMILTAFVFAVGRSFQRSIALKSEYRRIHGQYIFWWCVGAYAIVGLIGPFISDSSIGAHAVANFGLLFGWLAGVCHGALAIAFKREKPSHTTLKTKDHFEV